VSIHGVGRLAHDLSSDQPGRLLSGEARLLSEN
jgi:hypothetical protein